MPRRRTTPAGYERAHQLRKEPTPAESKLWAYLRGNKLHGVNFRRQHAVGKYVVDFCSPKQKVIIELDGSQHLGRHEYDADRTSFLALQGYRVLRFWNNEVTNNIDGVMRAVERALHGDQH